MKEMVANVLNDFKERKKNGCVRTIWVNTLPPEKFFMPLCCLLFFFSKSTFSKKNQEYHLSVKQIGSRSGPTFWVQSVCKGYQQKTLGFNELKVNNESLRSSSLSEWIN